MKLLFKQRFLSWFDSYDIFDENGNTAYIVKGKPSWGHKFKIYDKDGNELATIKQKIWTFSPKFEMYLGETKIGVVKKEITFFRPKFNVDYNGWKIEGNWIEWDYTILNSEGASVATIKKEIWNWTDTYSIDVNNEEDALISLMVVISIDAEKCSREHLS